MKAILTRYHGPTNTRGSRISATADGWGRASIDAPNDVSGYKAHWRAAAHLLDRAGVAFNKATMRAGTLANGDVVFVFADSDIFHWDAND